MTNPTRTRVAPGIWQLKKNLFEIRVRAIDPHSGAQKARWQKFEGSKKDALVRREELREEIESGDPEATPQRETLADFAHSWLSTKLARGDLRETTAERYASAFDKYWVPALGHKFVEAITPRDIERALTQWTADYRTSTINGRLRALHTALEHAVALGIIDRNPAKSVPALRERADDDWEGEHEVPNALTPEELCRYLDGWRRLYPDHFPLMLTLSLTGLRWGEATALKWTDIDAAEQRGALRIRRSQVRGIVRPTTKTERSRVVPFPGPLQEVLREQRKRHFEAQHPGLVEGWVFPSAVGKPLTNGALSKSHHKVLEAAGITHAVTIHGLRRTATDLLRRAAVDPVAAKAVIGHTTDRMRQHYSSVGADEARSIGDLLVAQLPGLTRR